MITELSLYNIAEEVAEQLEIGKTVEQGENTLLKQKEYEIQHNDVNPEFALTNYGIFEILETLKQSSLKFDYANPNSVCLAFYQYQLQQLNVNLAESSSYTKQTIINKNNGEDIIDHLLKAGDK